MIKIFRDKAIRTNFKINNIIKCSSLEVTAKICKVYNWLRKKILEEKMDISQIGLIQKIKF